MKPSVSRVTVVRAEGGKYADAFVKGGYAAIGWFDEPLRDHERDTVRAAYDATYPGHSPTKRGINAGQIYRFLNELQPGSVVLTPAKRSIYVGVVTGAPYFKQDAACPFAYRVPVQWSSAPLNRHDLSIPLQNTLGGLQTVYDVKQVSEVFSAAGFGTPPGARPSSVTPVASSASLVEQVRQALYELADDEFELLVGYVLSTLGFEPTQMQGKSGDKGIDFEGELNVYGVAAIQLQVQVKRQSSKVTEKQIRDFRGALKRDAQGCFVTLSDFDKKARASAENEHHVVVNLVNGTRFVELLTEQFEKVRALLVDDDNDALLHKLPFKKILAPA